MLLFLRPVDGIIFYNHRVFIPLVERNRVLEDIHKSHQGERKCICRATEVVWWTGMTAARKELHVRNVIVNNLM